MKWYSYLICCVLIVAGFFCMTNMIQIWSQTSGVYGQPYTIETENNYEQIAKFDFGAIAFETEDNVHYTSTTIFNPVENFNGENGDYALLVNDNLASDVTFYAGEIDCTYIMNVYNTKGEIVSTPVLDITIKILDTQTNIDVNITNEDNSYGYFTQYMNYNGIIFKIVERSSL